ncbi:MAG: SDR family NAD(P)-dependent oxidoreductase [Verrucomicrobia bacterium]|nr:SDR family NAD(P)-dependent oxidoreductase [Verrucomicrobiota bacterium]
MSTFRPKAAVIAGVGPGSGAAIARKLAKQGCAVGLIARSADYLDQLAGELRENKSHVDYAKADVSDADQIKSAFAQFRQTLGSIDLLVFHASAGGPFGQGLLSIDPKDFARSWAVGTLGGLLCAQAVVPGMLKKGAGAILFAGATSSVRGASISFSSSKFALRGLAQGLARELWPHGIHVAHVVIDAVIGDQGTADAPTGPEPLLDPDAMAEAYWQLAIQDRTAWTLELDLRPFGEKFFE